MFWKIYFCIILAVVILSHIMIGFPTVWEFLDLVANIVAMIGLWGFCWEYGVFRRLFWKSFAVAFVGWLIVYDFVIPMPQDIAEINPPLAYEVTSELVLIMLIVPWILALYLYSFRKSELWD